MRRIERRFEINLDRVASVKTKPVFHKGRLYKNLVSWGPNGCETIFHWPQNLDQMRLNSYQQQMSEHLLWHTREYKAMVVVPVLSVPIQFPERDNHSHVSVKSDVARLSHGRQHRRQPMNYGFGPRFQYLRTYITDPRYFTTLHLLSSLSYLRKRVCRVSS